jgi:hypothetical protein
MWLASRTSLRNLSSNVFRANPKNLEKIDEAVEHKLEDKLNKT